jgi:hypothetical protein
MKTMCEAIWLPAKCGGDNLRAEDWIRFSFFPVLIIQTTNLALVDGSRVRQYLVVYSA